MKTITIPKPILLPNQLTLSFQQFILENLLNDVQFGRDFESLEKCYSIKQATETSKDQLTLQDDAWELLAHVVQHPASGYQPKLAVPLIPFMKCIIDAEKA